MKRGPYNTSRHNIILDEYAHLRPYGLTREQIAERLGIQPESLRRDLQRAAKAGDPRSDWTPHTHDPSGTFEDLKVRRQRARGWVA